MAVVVRGATMRSCPLPSSDRLSLPPPRRDVPNTSPQACMESFVAALIRRDIDAALPLLTNDVALFYSNGTAVWGKDAFAAAITANWKQLDRYDYKTVEAIWLAQSDTAAAVIYTYSWSGL